MQTNSAALQCNWDSNLHHAILVELSPVAEEEEDLQQDKQRGRDEGLSKRGTVKRNLKYRRWIIPLN